MSRKIRDIRNKHKRKQRQKDETTLNSLAATKMIAMLALRNKGYGHSRLKEFSDDFNVILQDVSDGRFKKTDIWYRLATFHIKTPILWPPLQTL